MAAPPPIDSLRQIIRGRRSVRRFRPDPVPPELVDDLLDLACHAPSAGNRQAYRFVLVTALDVRLRMESTVRDAVERLRGAVRADRQDEVAGYLEHFGHFASAPLLIVPLHRAGADLLRAGLEAGPDALATPDRGERDALCSVSAAIMNLLLGAHALGLGACWMTGPLVARTELEALLEVPRGWSLSALIPVGYPDETPDPPPRRALAALVRRLGE